MLAGNKNLIREFVEAPKPSPASLLTYPIEPKVTGWERRNGVWVGYYRAVVAGGTVSMACWIAAGTVASGRKE